MAPPPNNNFADAQIIGTASGTVSGTTFDATTEAAEPSVGTQSVWYVWTCPADGWYKFTVPRSGHVYRGSFGFDDSHCNMAVFPTGTLTQMTAANIITQSISQLRTDNAGWDAEVAFFATASSVYYIKIACASGTTNTKSFDFQFLWTSFTRPANDDFINATIVSTVPTTLADQTTRNATFETGSETKDNGFSQYDKEQSLWYKFTPSVTGKYRIAIPWSSIVQNGHFTSPIPETDAPDWYVTIQVGTGTTIGTYQASEIDTAGASRTTTEVPEVVCYVDLTASTPYYIRIYSQYSSKTNDDIAFNASTVEFDLVFTAISPPANDNYANATVLSTTLPGQLLDLTLKDSTEEASEPSLPYTMEQSIWFSFTPTITGKYRFRIPLNSLTYDGVSTTSQGELSMSICPANGVANHTTANEIGEPGTSDVIFKMPESGWQSPHNCIRVADLTASTEYKIKVNANGGSSFDTFNVEVVGFDFFWERIVAPSNDNFASATSISGSSGTSDFSCLGATVETNEPVNFYWNDGGSGTQTRGTVWFTWTAPSSGWFKFKVETIELSQATHDLAIYTGSALNALTRINNAWAGTDPVSISPRKSTTAIAINATNGTTYKIQITGWNNEDGDDARLSWATMSAPVGDSAASAVVGKFKGIVDNYGHTDDDLPPNGVTLLSTHDEWWYNSGSIGKTKWFKYTAPQDLSMLITMQQWAETNTVASSQAPADCGLIAYKGANFASLTVAQGWNRRPTTDVLEDVVMLMTSNSYTIDGVTYKNVATTKHATLETPIPEIPMTAGETLWICIFGLWDDDIIGNGSVPGGPLDAAEFNVDLTFDALPPKNDNISDVTVGSIWGSPTWEFDLSLSHWAVDLVDGQRLAGQRAGTTFGATAQASEPAHAGYGPTRSVWYVGGLSRTGNWKFWVEATEDCVLSIYEFDATPDVSALTLIAQDDDSGAGNWPEVTFNTTTQKSIWVSVDSKVETNFVLKWEWQNDAAVIPPNNLFANAIVKTTPFIDHQTTVGASAEYFEWDSAYTGSGPTDSVWYKYTPAVSKTIKIDGRILSNNNDGYVAIEVFTGPDKDHLTRVSPQGDGGIFRGPPFPTSVNDPINLAVTAGTDYYIKVYTESGGSEEFEIWVDTDSCYLKFTITGLEAPYDEATIPLKLTPGGTEFKQSPIQDAATVFFRLTPSGVDDQPGTDSATLYLDLQPSGVDIKQVNALDAATIYLDLQPAGVEEHAHDCFAGEGNPDVRWYGNPDDRWTTDAMTPDHRFFVHLHKGAQYC